VLCYLFFSWRTEEERFLLGFFSFWYWASGSFSSRFHSSYKLIEKRAVEYNKLKVEQLAMVPFFLSLLFCYFKGLGPSLS